MNQLNLKVDIKADSEFVVRHALDLYLLRTDPRVENEAGEYDPGSTAAVPPEQQRPYYASDQLQVDPLSCSAARYQEIVEYLADNPLHVKRMIVSSDRAPTLKRLSYGIVRWNPFETQQTQMTPLAALLSSGTTNDQTIEIPCDLTLDGFTGIRWECSGSVEDIENFGVILEIDRVANARSRLGA